MTSVYPKALNKFQKRIHFIKKMEKESQGFAEDFIRAVKAEEEESQGLAESLIRAAKAGIKLPELEPAKSAEPEREI